MIQRSRVGASVRLATSVLLASHVVPRFKPRPSYSSVPSGATTDAKFQFEFDDSANFTSNVPEIHFPTFLRGKSVLDFGSGYGGRTAWLAQWARDVVGIEIFESMVREATRCTTSISNCRFVLGEEGAIRLPDASFDAIVTFDVLEHVERPDTIIREWYRVLKPGGTAIVVFTPYEGAFSHHLNYVSLAPGLHWMFGADTLMAAVQQLASGPLRQTIDLRTIPSAHPSYEGTRRVLPMLNGLTKRQFMRHVHENGFRVERMTCRGVLDKYRMMGALGRRANSLLCRLPALDSRLSINLTAVLTRPEAS